MNTRSTPALLATLLLGVALIGCDDAASDEPDDADAGVDVGACADGQLLTMNWVDFRTGFDGPGGLTICHPADWVVDGQGTNTRLLSGIDANGDAFHMTLSGSHYGAHADTLETLQQNVGWNCIEDDYRGDFRVIGGWPALEQRFDFHPLCGECGPGMERPLMTRFSTLVGAGRWFLGISTETERSVDAATADQIVAVSRSLVFDRAAEAAIDAESEVAQLSDARQPCGQ